MSAFGWQLYGDGRTPPPGAVVRPDERLSWPRTFGLGGQALFGDGIGTALASLVGGSPTTTYAENIGVMAATRVYSTAAYYVAAVVAILLGFIPKFGAVVAGEPHNPAANP